MTKKFFICLLLLGLFSSMCFGETLLKHTNGSPVYELTVLDTDKLFPYVVWVDSIEFKPSAAGEYISLKYITETGENICFLGNLTDTSSRVKYFDSNRILIFYDASESNVTANSKIVIVGN